MTSRNFPAALLTFLVFVVTSVWSAPTPRQLSGTVTESDSGKPLQGVTVKLLELGKTTNSDAQGTFIFDGIPTGNYQLEVSTRDYYTASTSVQFSADEGAVLEFVMHSRASLMNTSVVTVYGQAQAIKDTARSVGIIEKTELDVTKLVGLDEVLNAIPGVKAENQSGSEQVRVSIRGRDVRNSFGIIGIKLLVDGIPESDASGETPDITGIDMAAADRIEVVKGPMSARYGASAAGVVNLISRSGTGVPQVNVDNYFGSYGFSRNQLDVGGNTGLLDYFIDASRAVADGYREHSAFYAYRTSGHFGFQLAPSVRMNVFVKFNHSNDQLPGALTQEEYAADPNQASFLYNQFSAKENIARAQGGLTIDKSFGDDKVLSATVFSRVLDYDLSVPFVFIDGHRPESGLSVKYGMTKHTNALVQQFSFGLDYQHEHDDLTDSNNNAGKPVPPPEAHQIRKVDNFGLYAFDQLSFRQKVNVTAGINYSRLNFDFNDLLGTNSGSKLYDRVSYQIAAAYHIRSNVSAYANLSTGFEVPTLSELGRTPEGTPGINAALKPALSTNYEVGGLVDVLHGHASVNLSLFRSLVANEIVPTGIGFPQQTFDNAAKTVHNGFEGAVRVHVYRDLNWNVAYTYANFYYRQYVNLLGQNANSKQIPALPRNHFYSSLRYSNPVGLSGGIECEAVGRMFADDLNTAISPKYLTANAYVAYEHSLLEGLRAGIHFGIDNLNNGKYVAYVVPNDAFGSYFYPAAGRNYFGSVQLTWQFLRRK